MRFGVVLFALLIGCVSGGADDGTSDASVDAGHDTTTDSASSETMAAGCDPASDPCPPDQNCSPLLRQCIPGCRANEGCPAGKKCDVANHACVECLADSDCTGGMICSGNVCSPPCSATMPCPSGKTCCSSACVDTKANVNHCGGCGIKCTVSHGSAACSSGKCTIAACDAPWSDCDSNSSTGCETDTSSTLTSCGGCGVTCNLKNATGDCMSGSCTIASCSGGFGNCDGDAKNGCETNLATDPKNCGSCGNAPAETCNLKDDNCNGACDDVDGCRTAVSRNFNGSDYFYTTDPSESGCCGYSVQANPYFWLYASSQPDTTQLYRCWNATAGRHFYTTSSTCELWGATALEGTMGWIATKAVCGSVPLYRLSSGATHLFTTDASERSAKLSAGWNDEGMAGYVWTAPKG